MASIPAWDRYDLGARCATALFGRKTTLRATRTQCHEQVVLAADDRRAPDTRRAAVGMAVDDDGFLTIAEGSGGLPPEFAILSVFRRDG
ncbi:hypothetical protein BCEP4_1080020 [Burkholderia cepacia]|nr:hypothetical protein BCEP4_1080020 [Burkholderia cepacia]